MLIKKNICVSNEFLTCAFTFKNFYVSIRLTFFVHIIQIICTNCEAERTYEHKLERQMKSMQQHQN